ncbi:MAG: hypothetical protein HYY01_02830 [Chloroflexi bacterium]|nr:hypothetical protein [Chloroflexota bacterium]
MSYGRALKRDWVFRGDLVFAPDKHATPPPLEATEIGLGSIGFYPTTFAAKAGTTLTWVNNDMVSHTVAGRNWAFSSPVLKPGESFRFTFGSAGVFEYICSIHPGQMRARIEVEQ